MASTANKLAYGTPAQVAATIGSLATGSTRESASVSNTANLYFDYQVELTFTIASGSPSTTGPYVNVYANGSVDGTLWPIIQLSSGAPKATAGTDASIGALAVPSNLPLIGTFALQTTSSSGERTFRTPVYYVSSAYGACPEAISFMIENQMGVAFSTSTVTTANYLEVTPIYSTSGN